MLFLQANLGNILLILISIIIYFFFGNITIIPLSLILILCYLDATIFNISFEYQRITLIIARIAKASNSALSIPQLQVLMTNNKIVPFMVIDAVISSMIIGYFLHTSILFLFIFLIVKYFLGIFIPTYKPYKLLFKYIGQELKKNTIELPQEYIEKIRLNKYYSELPHNKEYELWAYKKYKNLQTK